MVLETYTNEMFDILTGSDFGWFGNIIPLLLVLGIAWSLSRKDIDMAYTIFPLAVVAKIIFPFFHVSFVIITFALFIMNIIGSKGDLLAEVKSIPSKTLYKLKGGEIGEARRNVKKELIAENYQKLKQELRDNFGGK